MPLLSLNKSIGETALVWPRKIPILRSHIASRPFLADAQYSVLFVESVIKEWFVESVIVRRKLRFPRDRAAFVKHDEAQRRTVSVEVVAMRSIVVAIDARAGGRLREVEMKASF